MKRRLFLGMIVVLGVFSCNYSAQASTEIKYGKPVPSVWTKEGSPYIIVDYGFFIPTPVTIEPGVVVKLKNSYTYVSFSSLYAVGTETEKIIFTSFKDDTSGGDTNGDGTSSVPGKGDWDSVLIPSGSQATIEYARFLYGSASPTTANFTTYSSSVSVKNSEMKYGLYNGVSFGYGAKPIFENNIITDNNVGIYLVGYSFGQSVKIFHNVIAGNLSGVIIDGFIGWFYETKLYAENNWWGYASGPYYKPGVYYGMAYPVAANLDGKGNSVVDGVSFVPWLGGDPFAPKPSCTENCFSNVLFLPGVEASRLYTADKKVWEPSSDADAEKLYLDENGKSIRDDIYTKDVLDNAYIPIKGNIYKSFLADLNKWKNADGLITDYVAMPYDWRLSLDDILKSGTKTGDNISYTHFTDTPYIIEELRRLASTSKSGKVTLIAHSNGGLVAKALVNKLGAEAEQLIDKIVFVAVPQTGTPQAIGAILHGYDQGLPVNWLPFALAPRTARVLVQTMPSAYNLLPADSYFSGEGSGINTPVITFEDGVLTQPFIDDYGNKVDTSTELKSFLSDNTGKVTADSSDTVSPSAVNSELLSSSDSVHQTLDDLVIPSSIAVYQIAGFGEDTLGTIKYWTGEECLHEGGKICSSRVPKLEYTPELVVDGDGTVVAPSALAMGTSVTNAKLYWVDLNKYNNELPGSLIRFDGKHANILEIPELRDFVRDNILTQSVTTLPYYLSGSEPPTSSEKRLRYYLHSPLDLSAHDNYGNVISATDDNYPGAEYRRFGEVQYISLSAASHPTVVLDGQAEGSFTLEVQEVEGDTVTAETTFAGIPSSATTEATMNFPDGTIANASPLTIDYDGNGSTDFSLKPKSGETVVFDIVPPEVNIQFNPTTKKLDITGKDDVSDTVTVAMTDDTATLNDEADNTTVVTFAKNENGKQIKFEIKSLAYDNVSASVLPVTLNYEWSLEKTGDVKMLNEMAIVGNMQVQAHYLTKDNTTVITKTADSVTTSEIKPGLSVLQLVTEKGVIKINY